MSANTFGSTQLKWSSRAQRAVNISSWMFWLISRRRPGGKRPNRRGDALPVSQLRRQSLKKVNLRYSVFFNCRMTQRCMSFNKKHDSHSNNRITDICLVIFIIFLSLNKYFCTFLYRLSTLNFPPFS